MSVICNRDAPVSKPLPVDGGSEVWRLDAICSKLAPTQGALRSGHQWSDSGVDSPEAPTTYQCRDIISQLWIYFDLF